MIELVFIVMFPIFFLLAIAFGLQMWAEIIEDFAVWIKRNSRKEVKNHSDYYYHRYLVVDGIGVKIFEITPQTATVTHFERSKPGYLKLKLIES